MSRLRILFLSPDFRNYSSAFYQLDVIDALRQRHDVTMYGPGCHGYRDNETIDDVLARLPSPPNLICIGHGWLNDSPDAPVDVHPKLDLAGCTLPKTMFLNKEYSKLEEKLAYVRDNQVDLVFTHHHDAPTWSEKTGIPFVFWPFAVNTEKFRDYGLEKRCDLSFSGILRNTNFAHTQSDIRSRIKQQLFWTASFSLPAGIERRLHDMNLCIRYRYRGVNIFWGEWSNGSTLSKDSYVKHMNRTRICLNTLSPLGLVGTRYYEAMASRSLVLCEASPNYQELFEDGKHYVSFKPDLSDFQEKLVYYLDNPGETKRITDAAYEHVRTVHTWEQRIQEFTDAVAYHLN